VDNHLTAILGTSTLIITGLGFIFRRIDKLCDALSKHTEEDAKSFGRIDAHLEDLMRRMEHAEERR